MIAKRIVALVASAGLIVGAVAIRDRVIEDGDTSDRPSATPGELVCAAELAVICRNLGTPALTVRIEEAGITLDALVALEATDQPPLWLTFDPFPAMIDALRAAPGQSPIGLEVQPIASSPIALITTDDGSASGVASCGEPVSWKCLGDSAMATGFARSTDSGTGLLGVAQATVGYSSTGDLMLTDAQFQRWLRTVVVGVPSSRLSGGTAIATIQTRPSSMDVAVGAEADLGPAGSSGFGVQYADPMIRADVALAVPPGATVPSGLVDELTTALVAAGWKPPASTPNQLPDAATMTAIRSLWKELA